MLTVHNKNDFDFSGRFNGVDYNFPAGKITAVPDDAARHIFGVGMEEKQEIMVRHGWMRTSSDFKSGMDILNKFSFYVADTLQPGEIIEAPADIEVEEVTVEVAEEETAQGSAPLQTGSGGVDSEADTDVDAPPQPILSGGSILDTLSNVTGS